MFKIMTRKIKSENLTKKLGKLGQDERWLYKAQKLTNEDYHASAGLSSSIVKGFADDKNSDYFCYRKYVKKDLPQVSSPAFAIGSAFHKIVLEPDHFDDEFIVSPKFDKRTKAGKEAYAEWSEKAEGKTLLSVGDMDLLQQMKAGVMMNDHAKEILKSALPEVSVFFRDTQSGLLCKARADALTDDCIFDVKTMDNVSPDAFMRDVVKFGYHIQAAFYQLAFCMDKFKFICVSKKAPFECVVYELDEEFLEVGHLLARDAIDRFNECIERNQWFSWTNAEENEKIIKCPSWLAARVLGS